MVEIDMHVKVKVRDGQDYHTHGIFSMFVRMLKNYSNDIFTEYQVLRDGKEIEYEADT